VTSHITKRRSPRKEEHVLGWKICAENMLEMPSSMSVQWQEAKEAALELLKVRL
jgi:hypothetical protein